MVITDKVESFVDKGYMYSVTFKMSRRPYSYRKERLLILSDPELVDLSGRGLYVHNKCVRNAVEIYRFTCDDGCYWHIIYEKGYFDNFEGSEVYISRTSINQLNGNLWSYFRQVASETGLLLKVFNDKGVEDDKNLLLKQFDLVDSHRDNVPLAQYLGKANSLKQYRSQSHVIYPFGCNASQKRAVERALTNQLSIIQGPPGTGKTQTILNIIANLLMADKNVIVVSNNNSAVDNVLEKLSKPNVGLGFVVAKLGSVENRAKFIEGQLPYPDMSSWFLDDVRSVTQGVDTDLSRVARCFEMQERLADLQKQLSAIKTERHYDELLSTDATDEEWLAGKSSSKLMKMIFRLQNNSEAEVSHTVWLKILWSIRFGIKFWSLLKLPSQVSLSLLNRAYYNSRVRELENEIQSIQDFFAANDYKNYVSGLRDKSMLLLRHKVANHYRGKGRIVFDSINTRNDEFYKEYPVVLSTTYSAKSCAPKDGVFDYLIMDEASQVDIATGALALSCATNVVIVGDDKQLPNVIDGKTRQVLTDIEDARKIDDCFRLTTHSFLQSCVEVFNDSPSTLLREHYRCHPKIIEFCNKMFYDNELLIMTPDHGEDDVLQVYRTVPGNHARGRVNQREVDVIDKEVMPALSGVSSVGIITPYRDQVALINDQCHSDIASTVHKYQGRECDCIILSLVDNEPTDFSDDASLLNVAISRAKSRLCVVATGNDIPSTSILAQLIGYIRYNNFDVIDSKMTSVFDILYKQYTRQRLLNEKPLNKQVSDQLSENIIYDALEQAITAVDYKNIDVLCHYPLSKLVADWNLLTTEQRQFAETPLAHVDFLIYNSMTKQPLMCVEVDGWQYHNTEVQHHRDALKDDILGNFALKPVRLSTTAVVTVDTLAQIIKEKISL